MTRGTNRLTARAVATAAAKGYHADGGGLYLQVSTTGSKSWIFRYALRGRSRDMGLGPLSVVSLASAREKAAAARRLLADRVDPIEARARSGEAGPTFGDMVGQYIEANRAGWRNAKHVAQWETTLATYAAGLTAKPVGTIQTADVVRALTPIWSAKTETATRVRQRIEAVLNFASATEKRKGENPARWRGHLDKILPRPSKVSTVEHFPALPYADLPAFIGKLRQAEGTAARALEFTILCATRTSESTQAESREFDLDAKLWTIPGSRMKAGRVHVVPLSPRAVELVDTSGRFVFTYRDEPLSNGAMLALLERLGYGHVTVHGFRSTFRDWAAECTHHPAEVVEMVLAHTIRSKVEAAYRRGALLDKRRALMDEWARFAMPPPDKPRASAQGSKSRSRTPASGKRRRGRSA